MKLLSLIFNIQSYLNGENLVVNFSIPDKTKTSKHENSAKMSLICHNYVDHRHVIIIIDLNHEWKGEYNSINLIISI